MFNVCSRKKKKERKKERKEGRKEGRKERKGGTINFHRHFQIQVLFIFYLLGANQTLPIDSKF